MKKAADPEGPIDDLLSEADEAGPEGGAANGGEEGAAGEGADGNGGEVDELADEDPDLNAALFGEVEQLLHLKGSALPPTPTRAPLEGDEVAKIPTDWCARVVGVQRVGPQRASMTKGQKRAKGQTQI